MSAPDEAVYPTADLTLARRLERAEGAGSARFIETRARLQPDSGAAWIEVAGAYAMYDGPSSPLTQTFGLGMSTPVGTAELDALESFYRDRDAPVFHEVCPLADASVWELLHRRGYRPVEFTSVMYRPVPRRGAPPPDSRLTVRRILPGEESLWAETSARGWSESAELARFMLEFGRVSAECTEPFLAVLDGRPIAAGVLSLHGGVALLAGAATVPEARRQGAQRALLEARLRHAAQQGCDLAMMCAQPGSASQRNAERHGFRIAYTRLKWQLSAPAAAKPGSGG